MARRNERLFRPLQALIGVALLSTSPRASAEVAHSDAAEWRAPEGCPDATAFAAGLQRLTDASLPDARAFKAIANVTADEDHRFTLVLSVRSAAGKGTRTVRSDSCEELLSVAALGVALAIEPARALTTRRVLPEPNQARDIVEGQPPAVALAAPVSPSAPRLVSVLPMARSAVREPLPDEPTKSRPGRPELWLGAHGLVDTSLLPKPALGFGAAAEALLLATFRVGLGGQFLIPQTHYLSSGSGGRFSFAALDVHACWQSRRRGKVAVCPMFLVGRLHGEGRSVSRSLTQNSSVLAPGLSLSGSPALSRKAALVLGASGVFPVKHDVFLVNAGTVHQVPTFTVQLWVGIAVRAF